MRTLWDVHSESHKSGIFWNEQNARIVYHLLENHGEKSYDSLIKNMKIIKPQRVAKLIGVFLCD